MTQVGSLIRSAVCGGGLVLLAGPALAQAPGVVLLTAEPSGDGTLVVISRLHALAALEGNVEVSLTRQAAAGRLSLSQSRALSLQAGDTAEVGRSQISYAAGDYLDVTAMFYVDGQPVADSRLILGAGRQ